MANANTQQFDNIGNKCGTLAGHIRAAAELLEIEYVAGVENVFGEIETEISIAKHIESNKFKAASILESAIKALSV